MTAQLDLFATAEPVAARRLGHIHNIQLLRRPYQLRDDAEARRVILDVCGKAGDNWTPARQLFRATGQRPQDVAQICTAMVACGELEQTRRTYWRGDKYQGFTYAYRLAGRCS